MAASKTLETVLNHVKSSNLNFHLQQSPFSATISIKASFVKNKAGISLTPNSWLHPPHTDVEHQGEVLFLTNKINSLKETLEDAFAELTRANKDKEVLEEKVEAVTALNRKLQLQNQKLEKEVSDVKSEVDKVNIEKQGEVDKVISEKQALGENFAQMHQQLSQRKSP